MRLEKKQLAFMVILLRPRIVFAIGGIAQHGSLAVSATAYISEIQIHRSPTAAVGNA